MLRFGHDLVRSRACRAARIFIATVSNRRPMSLRNNVVPAITCALLLIGGVAAAWATARIYVPELRSYYNEELTTVTLEASGVTPRKVSL